jgi:hypothetical protein
MSICKYLVVGLLLIGCSGAQTAKEAATCSPNAELWWEVEMAKVCGTDPDCESPKLDQEYLYRECMECARTEAERSECLKP